MQKNTAQSKFSNTPDSAHLGRYLLAHVRHAVAMHVEVSAKAFTAPFLGKLGPDSKSNVGWYGGMFGLSTAAWSQVTSLNLVVVLQAKFGAGRAVVASGFSSLCNEPRNAQKSSSQVAVERKGTAVQIPSLTGLLRDTKSAIAHWGPQRRLRCSSLRLSSMIYFVGYSVGAFWTVRVCDGSRA